MYCLYLHAAIFTGVDGNEFTYMLIEHSAAVTYDGKYRSNFVMTVTNYSSCKDFDWLKLSKCNNLQPYSSSVLPD